MNAYKEIKFVRTKMHYFIWEKFRIRLNLFRIRTKFRINFLTETCKDIINSSGVRQFCQNSKYPD